MNLTACFLYRGRYNPRLHHHTSFTHLSIFHFPCPQPHTIEIQTSSQNLLLMIHPPNTFRNQVAMADRAFSAKELSTKEPPFCDDCVEGIEGRPPCQPAPFSSFSLAYDNYSRTQCPMVSLPELSQCAGQAPVCQLYVIRDADTPSFCACSQEMKT